MMVMVSLTQTRETMVTDTDTDMGDTDAGMEGTDADITDMDTTRLTPTVMVSQTTVTQMMMVMVLLTQAKETMAIMATDTTERATQDTTDITMARSTKLNHKEQPTMMNVVIIVKLSSHKTGGNSFLNT